MTIDWLIAHLVGDFLLQNDWMAQGKKRSTAICLAHILAYALPFIGLTALPQWREVDQTILGWQIVLILVQHFVQDRTHFVTWFMKTVGQGKGFMQPPMAPWSMIVVDNTFHLLWIYLVLTVPALI